LLVAEGLLPESVIHRALGYQRLSGERIKLGSILLDWDLLGEEALLATLSKHYRCPSVEWSALSAASMDAVRLLSLAQASRFAAFPFQIERGTVLIAFGDPSNLAVIDEISSITGKHVRARVTTEVRLMQAHQKFYGRHIPGAFRTILQKLGRRTTTQVRRNPEPIAAVDFRAPDLVAASATVVPVNPVEDPDLLTLPEIPSSEPASPAAAESGAPASDAAHTAPSASTELAAAAQAAPSAVAPHDPLRSGEDSLSEWVGEALASFQEGGKGTNPSSSRPAARADSFDGDATAPIAAAPTTADVPSGMWSAPASLGQDDVAAGMWKAGEELPEPLTRDEIGDAVLRNALTHLPRVLLFGNGKAVITGWRGRAPRLSEEEFATVRIPSNAHTVFAAILAAGVPHFGPVERSEWPAALGSVLGKTPPDCAIFPIRVFDDVAAFLYADRAGQPMQYTDFALIARAAASTANILSRFLHRASAAPVS
jgi:hypothetical protein